MPSKFLFYENPIEMRTYRIGRIYEDIDPRLTTTNILTQDVLIIHHTHKATWTRVIDKVRMRAEKKLYSKILYDYPYEAGLGHGDFEEFAEELKPYAPYVLDVFYILNNSCKGLYDVHSFHYDHFAADIYDRLTRREVKMSSMAIWQRPKSLSILVGKVDSKLSRLYTLYRLFEHDLLKDAMTGIINDFEDFDDKKHLIDNVHFWEWLEKNLGPVDYTYIIKNATSGYPYNVKTYDYTKISVICETNTDEFEGPPSFITEKTYRPILNRTPFIMQGYQGHLDYIRDLGFDTYDRFLSNKDYLKRERIYLDGTLKKPDDPLYQYIKAIPIHTKELLDACEKYESEVSKIALQNQQLMLEYGKGEQQKLIQVLKDYVMNDN